MPKVIVVASAYKDLTVKAERLPRSGETVVGTDAYGNCVYDRMVRSGLASVKNAKKISIWPKLPIDQAPMSL